MNEWNESFDRELWEPGSTQSRLELERRLRPLRFDVSAHPLRLSPPHVRNKPAVRQPIRWIAALAAAAVLIIASGSALLDWRLQWPEGRAWSIASAPRGDMDRLAVGDELATGSSDSALVRVARIGWLRAFEDTRLVLRSTDSRRHRLALENGTVHVSVWAPPASVILSTPSGTVIDMGCEFIVSASGEVTSLRVLSGWAQLENRQGEVLVPAGASSTMRKGAPPTVPLYDDASPLFVAAVREAGREDAALSEQTLAVITSAARPRDALTLIVLARRLPVAREQLLLRAHELAPVVDEETVKRAVQGSDHAIWQWVYSLPLPSPKDWKRNWRDAFRPTL